MCFKHPISPRRKIFFFFFLGGLVVFLSSFLTTTSSASAQKPTAKTTSKPKICMILDRAGKDDRSFNAQAYAGFVKAQKELAISSESKYVTPAQDSQIPVFIRELSQGDCHLIIAVGFTVSEQVGRLAKQYPGQLFLALDAPIQGMNVRAITFKDHEGAFLMGYIAALKSTTGMLGFLGGMEIPLTKRFAMAYEAGAKYANPKVTFRTSFVGTTGAAWTNLGRAKELALSQYNQNIDVIFAVAGGASQGVFDAAREKNTKNAAPKRYVIGVDSNQNAILPGTILTSMEKRLDVAVFSGISDLWQGRFLTGVYDWGLAQGGVAWSYDQYNKSLFSAEDVAKIKNVEQLIATGKIDVPDFYKNTKPPR